MRLLSVFAVIVFSVLSGAVLAIPVASEETATMPGGAADSQTPSQDIEELVIRFESLRSNQSAASEISKEKLQKHARETQAPFKSAYEANPHVTIKRTFWVDTAILVEVDTGVVNRTELLEKRFVESVHSNYEYHIQSTRASVPAIQAQTQIVTSATGSYTYGLELINAPSVWDEFDTRGEGTTVAVLDTGIDPEHSDLTVDSWVEFDSEGQKIEASEPFDNNGHGTHVAGTVGGGNASGTAIGVAPDSSLYGVKVFDDDGSATFAQILAGLEWSVDDESVDIVQMSFGSSEPIDEPDFIGAIQNLRELGKVPVASSGNNGVGTSSSPGNMYDSLAIGAIDEAGHVPDFSSGETIITEDYWQNAPAEWPESYLIPDVVAPGVGIESAAAGTEAGLTTKSGTSMAAPHVGGIIALALSGSDEDLTSEELRAILRDAATHPDGSDVDDDRYGHGIVDALDVVAQVTDSPTQTTAFDVSDFTAPDSVVAGETITVEATITNSGETTGNQLIAYRFDGATADSEIINLEPGESTVVTLEYDSAGTAPGTYEHGIFSDDDQQTAMVTLDEPPTPPFFAVENLTGPTNIVQDEILNTSATINNTGDVEDSQNIDLRVNKSGDPLDDAATVTSEVVLLDGQDEVTIALEATMDFEPGEYEYGLFSADDNATAPLEVTARQDPTVRFDDQLSDGASVTVANATAFEEYVIGVHTGDVEETAPDGVSNPLQADEAAMNTRVNLSTRLAHTEAQTLTAVLYTADDTDTNKFGEPIQVNGDPVSDTALVDVDGRLHYIGEDDRIKLSGLRDAIRDWRSGTIGLSLLRDVIQAWRSGTVLT